ncbi:MAG: hypothetical protein JKY99_07985 [Rhizobiales bacterium]|nr:hypothetical protein [Hyphomicrobiales bacterium]
MPFDFTAVAWYAAICGVLSALAPSLGGVGLRLAIGAGVGVLAATVLPELKGMMGY